MGDEPQVWISDDPGGGHGPSGPSRGTGRARWIVPVAGFAALIALIAAQHHFTGAAASTAPTTTASVTDSPTTTPAPTAPSPDPTGTSSTTGTTVTLRPPPTGTPTVPVTTTTVVTSTTAPATWAETPFELVGLAWNGSLSTAAAVIAYRSDTGAVVRTELPSLMSNGPLSFVVTDTVTVVRPWDGVPGYVVPDGWPPLTAGNDLGRAGPVFPAAEPDRLWVLPPDDTMTALELVDTRGKSTGPIIAIPASLGIQAGWTLTPDGAGGVLAAGIGGTYDLRPGEVRLVTHGIVLAAGPTGYLVYDCDEVARCEPAVIDRGSGERRALPASLSPVAAGGGWLTQGVISPDGRYAASLGATTEGPPLSIIDLSTGAQARILLPIDGYVAAFSMLAFTPDSRQLLVISGDYVRAVDPVTGTVLGDLPVPSLAAIAVRPVG